MKKLVDYLNKYEYSYYINNNTVIIINNSYKYIIKCTYFYTIFVHQIYIDEHFNDMNFTFKERKDFFTLISLVEFLNPKLLIVDEQSS